MSNLKEIKNRITSIASTTKITSAMKMVSAAKLRKAQQAIEGMRPYCKQLAFLLEKMSSVSTFNKNEKAKNISKILLVVITSNRGLCGGFNSAVVKKTKKRIAEKYENCSVDLLTIGKKGFDLLHKNYNILEHKSEIYENRSFENCAKIAENLLQKFKNKTYDSIEIIYNHFKNAANQIVKVDSFLPLQPKIKEKNNAQKEYIFEPKKQEILKDLQEKFLKMQLFKAIKDSIAAEHGARMTAMHKATDNAKELKSELLLKYNKERQAAITAEILEIVGGAEAIT